MIGATTWVNSSTFIRGKVHLVKSTSQIVFHFPNRFIQGNSDGWTSPLRFLFNNMTIWISLHGSFPPLLAGWVLHARSTFLRKRSVFSALGYGKNLRRKQKKGVWGVYYRLVSVALATFWMGRARPNWRCPTSLFSSRSAGGVILAGVLTSDVIRVLIACVVAEFSLFKSDQINNIVYWEMYL
jgi:hypothetical protein